jgi:hypothetical protein
VRLPRAATVQHYTPTARYICWLLQSAHLQTRCFMISKVPWSVSFADDASDEVNILPGAAFCH